MTKLLLKIFFTLLFISVLFSLACSPEREKINSLNQLKDKEFAVPTGTAADKLVLSKFPKAQFLYFNSVLDACYAVKTGKADAAAYDEPILKNIAAKMSGLRVIPEMITTDNYGFAVRLDNETLRETINKVLSDLKNSGTYEKMLKRWLPEKGSPAPMPVIQNYENRGVLKFGTSAITEPFSFMDSSQKIVGLDIEIASLVAKELNMKLEIINMDFGAMIPALISDKVDMIGACITITKERSEKVLFSAPYYKGGIAAIIKK